MSPPPLSPRDVVKRRWLGFLIWESIASTALYLISSSFLPRRPFPLSLLSFLSFHLSHLLLSLSFFLLASPRPEPSASLAELAKAPFAPLRGELRRRVRRALDAALFAALCCVSGFLAAAAACGDADELVDTRRLLGLGLRGSVFGLVFGIQYLYRKRWVLRFPIIQRPLFYSFKMGLPSSIKRAVKLSIRALFCSFILMLFLPKEFKGKRTIGRHIIQQIKFLIGTFTVSLCWEISHHLLQFVSKLAEGLEGFYVDKADFLSQQLNLPLDIQVQSRIFEAFNDFQNLELGNLLIDGCILY